MGTEIKKKTAIIILSHELLKIQTDELKEKFNVTKIIYLQQKNLKGWKNVSSEGELDTNLIKDIRKFILENTNDNDYVVIQGEWGMTVAIVNICFNENRIPIYSTTERKVKEIRNNNKVKTIRIFEHKQFRKYIHY